MSQYVPVTPEQQSLILQQRQMWGGGMPQLTGGFNRPQYGGGGGYGGGGYNPFYQQPRWQPPSQWGQQPLPAFRQGGYFEGDLYQPGPQPTPQQAAPPPTLDTGGGFQADGRPDQVSQTYFQGSQPQMPLGGSSGGGAPPPGTGGSTQDPSLVGTGPLDVSSGGGAPPPGTGGSTQDPNLVGTGPAQTGGGFQSMPRSPYQASPWGNPYQQQQQFQNPFFRPQSFGGGQFGGGNPFFQQRQQQQNPFIGMLLQMMQQRQQQRPQYSSYGQSSFSPYGSSPFSSLFGR